MHEKHERLLALLARAEGWVTAAELAGQLAVTPRSVRSYIAAIKAEAAIEPPPAVSAVPRESAESIDVIESGPEGYRLNRERFSRWRAGAAPSGPEASGGRSARIARLLRRLVDSSTGLDVYEIAADSHLSESTIEADLVEVRSRLAGSGLTLRRNGPIATVEGPETARRRVLSSLFRSESEHGMFELDEIQREFDSARLSDFKTALISLLEGRGDLINEYGLSNVLLHISIAVDRVRRDHALADDTPGVRDATALASGTDWVSSLVGPLGALVEAHFGVTLGPGDLDYLGFLLSTRVVTAGQDQPGAVAVERYLHPQHLAQMRDIVGRAAREYLVELDDEEFLVRLTLHARNLVARAHERSYSRNPLTRSIKAAYPMTYELAVYIARELARLEGIEINDDEIAYIAMHVGAQLEQRRKRDDDVTVSIVSPSYHELHMTLLRGMENSLGQELTVVHVATRTDVDWEALPGELVVSTLEPPVPHPRVIVVQPFFGEADVELVRAALARVRRHRRRARLAAELLEYFEPELFVRNAPAVGGPEGVIRMLGQRMIEQGIVDRRYVDGAIEREAMSSTAFSESLAVPHAMEMTAQRTAIAIALNDSPIDWHGSRVSLVAFIAFSEAGRAHFQGFFEQFVEVFSEREAVQRLLGAATDFPSFLQELVRIMDD